MKKRSVPSFTYFKTTKAMEEEAVSTHNVPWTMLLTIVILLSYQRGLRKNFTMSRITTDTRSRPCNMLTRGDSPLMSATYETCLETSTSSATRLEQNCAHTKKQWRLVSLSMASSVIHAKVLGVNSAIYSRKLESGETPSPSITSRGTELPKTNLCMPQTTNSNT